MFKLVSALRESPRRQPRPNGQVPPACQGPHVSRRPRRRVRSPPHARAPRLASQRGRPHDRRSLLMYRGPAAHPHLRAHAGSPSLFAYIRGSALADGPAAQGAARTHCQTRGAQYLGLPWPSLRHGRYSGPVCPQLFARAASPRRHRRARAPRRPWDAGPEGGCRLSSSLLCSGLAAGDVGLDAEHDAHGKDADDRGDAGGRRVQRDLSALSVPPTRPDSHSQNCAPPTSISRPRPVPGTFLSHTT